MISKHISSFAKNTEVERKCPLCGYIYSTGKGDQHFIRLETMQCYNHPQGISTTRLYACPKCGTLGIDVKKK